MVIAACLTHNDRGSNRHNASNLNQISESGDNVATIKNFKQNAEGRTRFLSMNKHSSKSRIASANVDILRTRESPQKLTMALEEGKIDIACIQETHNERNDTHEENGYIIISGRNGDKQDNSNEFDTNKKAGVAIAIKQTLLRHVKGIYKINGRLTELRLKTGKSIEDISILNPYAPHIGYPITHINNYWGTANAYISLIPNKLVRIRRTDNNGQLGGNETNQSNIGPWTKRGAN